MIEELIPVGSNKAISRRNLCELYGTDDRTMRQAIERARRKTPILNLEDGSGYFIPNLANDVDRKLTERWVKKIRSRAYKLLKIANVAEGHLGGNIYRSARQLACMTQGQVSQLTGISVPKLSEIETGKTIPTEEEHNAIEKACKVKIEL